MPHLHLSLCPRPGADPDLRALALQLTELTAVHLHKDPALTAVRLSLVPETQWFIGERSLAASARASYHLEVQITAGTNTEGEIADYLRATHAALDRALGGVHPTSYIALQALPASHWGYGGQSQAARRLAADQGAVAATS